MQAIPAHLLWTPVLCIEVTEEPTGLGCGVLWDNMAAFLLCCLFVLVVFF